MEPKISEESLSVTKKSPKDVESVNHTLPNVSTVTLILLVLSNIVFGAISSLPGPFFPLLARRKGLKPTIYGLIISTSHLSTLIFIPVMLIMIRKCPSKICLCLGCFTVGGCALLFGSLEWCPDGPFFISLAFLIRALEGFGAASIKISTCVIMASLGLPMPLLLSAYTSIENLYVAGLAVGPSVGAGLHHAEGYYLPFYCFGGFSIIVAIFIIFALKEPEEFETTDIRPCRFLKNWQNALYFFTLFTTYFYSGFLESTLATYLCKINIDQVYIALLFSLPCLVYNVMSPSSRWLLKKGLNSVMLIFIGGIILALSIALVGPVPFKRLTPLVTFSSVALALKGLATSGKTVSSIYGAYGDAVARGLPDNPTAFMFVFEMYAVAVSSGLFLGSSVSGCLYDLIEFRNASVIPLGLEIMMVPLILYYAFKRNYRRPVYLMNASEERQYIISSPHNEDDNAVMF